MKTKRQMRVMRQMRSIPGEIEDVLRKESARIGSDPNKVLRYLLKRAIRDFTPLDQELILP
jgi:hypothetical protein